MKKKASTRKKVEEKDECESMRFWSTPLLVAWVGIGILISVIIVGMILGSFELKPSGSEPVEGVAQELTLVERLGAHISIPEDEEPTIATVEDPEAMRQNNPGFYKKASEGDQLVVWSSLAVLYSPDKDLILAVLPLNVGQVVDGEVIEEPVVIMEEDPLKKEQELAKVEVLNGTRKAGLARTVSDLLEEEGFTTQRPRDARRKGYEETLVIKNADLDLPESIKALVDLLNAEIAELPEHETVATGDIIVILGSDYLEE